jgi:gliding motility-associated-like protein
LGHATTGSYSDLFTTAGGCDSVRVLNLTIKSVAVTRIVTNVTICQGESYAGYSTAGTYINVFKGVNTCDSIRTLNLTINPVARKTVNAQICKGFTYLAGGKQQTLSGTYIDSLKTSLGCDSVVTTILQVNPLPAFFLPIDSVVCIGKTLLINLSGYNSVIWNTGVTDKVFDISSAGIYGATVTDSKGCIGTDSIKVNFQRCIPIQVPNGFTPNGDGKNDYFRPLIGAQISNYRMQIWSRWGQLVFETRENGKGWNGKFNGEVQPNGAYIYFFSFIDPDGVPVLKKGTFVLIR